MTETAAGRLGKRAVEMDFDPFDEAFLEDPYPLHGALRDAGPVLHIPRYGIHACARYAEVMEVLRDHATYCSARGVGLQDFKTDPPWRPASLLLEADPPEHTRARTLMNRIVSLPALKKVRDRWQAQAEELADRLVARRRFDAVTDLAEVFPLSVFPDAIGIMEEGREHMLPYAAAVFNAYGPRNRVFLSSEAKLPAANAWVAEACKRKNLQPGSWGMGIFDAVDAGEISEEEGERLVRSFLSAGVDTTINSIGNMMLAFVTYPDQWAVLRQEGSLVRKAFEEALRWDSTAQIFCRTTTREVGLAGVRLPEGAKVLLFLAAANRDPRKWDNPDAFDIRRHTSGHVAFGYGIHQCLGQMVARQEVELLLAALRERIASIRMTGPLVRRLNNSLHAMASLPVEIEPA